MKKSITLDEVLSLPRCDDYPDNRTKELFGNKTEATAQDILTDVRLPDKDRVWLICYGGFLSKKIDVEFARFCANNARRCAELAAVWAEEAEAEAEAEEWAAQVEFLREKLK